MERLKNVLANVVFFLQVLILFFLVFEDRLVVPAFLQIFGRLHPLLLHLPIGLLVITVILLYTRRHFEGNSTEALISLLLHVTGVTASLTTLMGLFLSLEGTFGAEQLLLHKWFGVVLSFLCWMLIIAERNASVLKPLSLVGAVCLIVTGHFGASLTHGEDFVWAPLKEETPRLARVITDSTAMFSAVIEPIFESKCYGCHNEKKSKGNLVLTSLQSINAGGETGPLWTAGDASSSLLVERLLLPTDHEEHMPPKDKAQLTEEEVAFISLWVDHGADTRKRLAEFGEEDTLRTLAQIIIPRYQQPVNVEPKYDFAFARPEKIDELNRPNRTVFQIASNEPAVRADFFLRESFDKKYLDDLTAVKEQLVKLNLSNMPLNDGDLEVITRFQNLEELNLNHTAISGSGLKYLAELPSLESVSLSGTKVDGNALRQLGKSKSLREVFIWNTGATEKDSEALTNEFPRVTWNIGYVPDDSEVLKLNAPFAKKKDEVLTRGQKVTLRHNLPGTAIRYSLDGNEPDSLSSPLYTDPFEIGNYAKVKTKAFKEGWLSSEVNELIFFRKGYSPDTVFLLASPDERYKGSGAKALVDGLKGLPNYYKHPAWMGFRENNLELQFAFEKEKPTVSNITLSYASNAGAICLPPAAMELWGGNGPDDLKLLKRQEFSEATSSGKGRIEGATMDVPPSQFRYYKLVAAPRRELTKGNKKKRDQWLMVDEVFIN